nr:hypothetical protein [Priestia filamentosa]
MINYRKAHDGLGRAVITIDHKEIFSMCTIKTESKLYLREWEQRKKNSNMILRMERKQSALGRKYIKRLKKVLFMLNMTSFPLLKSILVCL